jgi:putative transcriptional regulator
VSFLRGQLLIAAPDLLDPTFRRTVVLIGEHSENGAMGIVLNRPSSLTVEEAIDSLAQLVSADDAVHIGGPVEPEAVIVLGEFAEPERAAALVIDAIGFLPQEADPDALGELGRARVYAGYAGWAPGQLEQELEEESWIVEPARAEDVFTEDPDALWSSVLRRKGGVYRVIATLPDDPTLN